MIELNKACIFYDSVLILSNITFSLSGNRAIGIWGGNGIGKTALLEAISGISNARIDGDFSINSKMVVINQNPLDLVLPWYNSLKNIKLFTKLSINDCHALLDNFNISEDDRRKRALQLSGGNQQRLAWACFLNTSYDTILLDEPFSKQDRTNKHLLVNMAYNKIFYDDKKAILISHDPVPMIKLCDIILILDRVAGTNYSTIIDKMDINLSESQRNDDDYIHSCEYLKLMLKTR